MKQRYNPGWHTTSWILYEQKLNSELLKENSTDYRTGGTMRMIYLIKNLHTSGIINTEGSWFNGMKTYRLYCLCNVYVLFFTSCFCVLFRCSDRANFF